MAKFTEIRLLAVIGVISLLASSNVVICSILPVEGEAVQNGSSDVGVDTDSQLGDSETAAVIENDNNSNGAVSNSEADSNCDCNDSEALYHKLIRQLIKDNVIKDKEEFLEEFPIKKICGSDGNLYSSECEFQCTKQKKQESDLRKVNRSKCKRFGKGRFLKGKENTGKTTKGKIHPHHIARMQRPESDPETLVCICPRNYMPVCASNGVTYGNRCAFDCARANIDKDIHVVTVGEKCDTDDVTAIQSA